MTTKTPFVFRLLYSFSILWLIGTSFALLWNVVFLFRSDHIYFGKGSYSPNPFKNGYSIPVKINIQLPSDTLVKWESKFDKSSGSFGLNSNVDFRYELADSILNDTVKYSKDIFLHQWGITAPFNNSVSSEIIDSMYYEKTCLKASIDRGYSLNSNLHFKSKKTIQNFAFALYPFLAVIFLLLISFNTYKFFKKITQGFKFTISLSKFIFNVGFTLVIWQVCKFLLSFTYSKWYGSVMVKHNSIDNFSNTTNISFSPLVDYNMNLIWLGLIFIALSYLFKYGSQLEKDQALTI